MIAVVTDAPDVPDAPRSDAPTYPSVDALLADARAHIDRLSPADAAAAVAGGARIVDIRPAWQRAVQGEIPGSLVVERNHLEWRLHPGSDARVAGATRAQHWIVVCTEGYTSSLAAYALSTLGIPARDVVGGVAAWTAAGLPLRTGAPPTEPDRVVPD